MNSSSASSRGAVPKIGQRRTRQKAAVVSVLQSLDHFSSAKAIHEELTSRKLPVGLTTVYRTLQSLVDLGEVDVLHTNSGEALYRHCSHEGHHHHLVCERCGSTVEIEGGPVEEWARAQASRRGFTLTSHAAEVFGLCPACAATARS